MGRLKILSERQLRDRIVYRLVSLARTLNFFLDGKPLIAEECF